MDENLILPDPRPSRSDAVKNRELLLETAGRLFGEQGVDAVSMSAVAEEAGVGKGTLYRHFENKLALCHALLDEDQRDLQERTLHRLRYHDDSLENLNWFLSEVVRFVDRNQEMLCVRSAGSTLDFPGHFWWQQTIRGLLERLDPPGDIDYTADVLYTMLDIRTIQYLRHARGYEMSRIIDGLKTLLSKLTS